MQVIANIKISYIKPSVYLLKFIADDPNGDKDKQEIENNSMIEFLQKDYPEREKMKRIIANKFIKVKRNFEMI